MTMTKRKEYYVQNLDPATVDPVTWDSEGEFIASVDELLDPENVGLPANTISSLNTDGTHSPALDIDIPIRIVPSSTPGHCHLFFDDIRLTQDEHEALLHALYVAGIIEPGYYKSSLARNQSILRHNVKKVIPDAS